MSFGRSSKDSIIFSARTCRID